MKKLIKILLVAGYLSYIFTIVITNIDLKEVDLFAEDSISLVHKNELVSSLQNKYSTLILPESSGDFTESFINRLLNSVTIIDTLQTDVVGKADELYIYVEAKSDKNGRIFAKLKCDESIADKVRNRKSPGALLAARINGVNKSIALGEIKISNQIQLMNIGEDVLLTGECLEYIELSNS